MELGRRLRGVGVAGLVAFAPLALAHAPAPRTQMFSVALPGVRPTLLTLKAPPSSGTLVVDLQTLAAPVSTGGPAQVASLRQVFNLTMPTSLGVGAINDIVVKAGPLTCLLPIRAERLSVQGRTQFGVRFNAKQKKAGSTLNCRGVLNGTVSY